MNFSSVSDNLQKEYSFLKSLLRNSTLNIKQIKDKELLEKILQILDSQKKPIIEVARKRNRFLAKLITILIEGNENISQKDEYSKFDDANFSITQTFIPTFEEIVKMYEKDSQEDTSTTKFSTHFDTKQMDNMATSFISLSMHSETDNPWQEE